MSEVIRASNSDLQKIVELLKTISPDLPRPLIGRVDLDAYAKKLLSRGAVFTQVNEGSFDGLVGGYVNNKKQRKAVISIIGVRAQGRRRGAGSELLRRFELEARRNGMLILELETHETNSAAIAFYKKHGFRQVGNVEHGNILLRKMLAGLTSETPNILLTSVGRRTYLVNWFKETLSGKGEVHVVNSTCLTPAFAAADKAEVCPLIFSKEYIPFLLNYCRENQIGAIVPLFDIDVPVLARNKDLFSEIGVFPVVAELEAALVCNDKYETWKILSEAGINVPNTYIDLEKCILDVGNGTTGFPLLVKPRWGMGSIGVAAVESEDELRIAYKQTRRIIGETYLKYESAFDLSRSVIIQEVIQGQEYGLDVVNNLLGEYQAFVQKKKIAMRSGETDVAEILEPCGQMEALAKKLSSIVAHPGNMDVDVFESDGNYCVLEMNARFGGGYPFSHMAGLNLPGALISWLRGEECNPMDLSIGRLGIYMKDISVVGYEAKNEVWCGR